MVSGKEHILTTDDRQQTTHMSKAIFILGMHRSGTSALARVINLLGAELGGRLMAAASDNERGFWEHESAVQIHEDLLSQLGHSWQDGTSLPEGWMNTEAAKGAQAQLATLIDLDFMAAPLWAIKDPRLSLLFPLWLPLLQERGIVPYCVIAWRHPLEVTASLQKRDHLSQEAALLCWLAYTLESMRHALPYAHVVVAYDEIMNEWQGTAAAMASTLGLTWPREVTEVAAAIEDFLAPELRHHKAAQALPTHAIGALVSQTVTLLEQKHFTAQDVADIATAWEALAAPFAPLLREARREAADWREKALVSGHQATDMQRQMTALYAEYENAIQREKELRVHQHMVQNALASAENQITATEAVLAEVYDSTSWKLTEPLRKAKKLLGE